METEIGYVYVIECAGRYKIGYSTTPRKRLAKLRKASPVPMRMVHKLRTPIFREIEQQLHARFYQKRLNGEWFCLDEDDLDYIRGLDSIGISAEIRARNDAMPKKTPEEIEACLKRINEAADGLGAFLDGIAEIKNQRTNTNL